MAFKPQPVVDNNGRRYESINDAARTLHISKSRIINGFKAQGFYKSHRVDIRLYYEEDERAKLDCNTKELPPEVKYDPIEIEEFIKYKNVGELPFTQYDFRVSEVETGSRYAVALFSDAHIEETVVPTAVLGLNEYNIDIAKKRIECYFNHLVQCIKEDGVSDLIFASLGDTISGYIHDELSQTNGLSPLEATFEAQNLIYNGLRVLCENTDLHSIKFIGICGNHSRTTKKIQHSNGYRLSYEWLMYKNIEAYCQAKGMPIEFCIPESELAIVNAPDGRRFLFMHGFQIKSSGNATVCGIFPALMRLTMKYDRTFHQDRVFLGHFHSCISIPNAMVNGSIIGYSAYSLSNGFNYEEPAQMYQLYDTKIGEMLTRKIYCSD